MRSFPAHMADALIMPPRFKIRIRDQISILENLLLTLPPFCA